MNSSRKDKVLEKLSGNWKKLLRIQKAAGKKESRFIDDLMTGKVSLKSPADGPRIREERGITRLRELSGELSRKLQLKNSTRPPISKSDAKKYAQLKRDSKADK